MRAVRIIIGALLLLKGLVDCVRMPAALAAAHQHAAAAVQAGTAYSAGYSVGVTAGLVVGVLILLAGGVLLIVDGWPRRDRAATAGTAA